MNTHEEYVAYAQAKALKELGFDWPCRYLATHEDAPEGQYWNFPTIDPVCNHECNDRSFTIPSQAVTCRWLREVEGVIVEARHSSTDEWYFGLYDNVKEDTEWDGDFYAPYESALSAGIDRALQLLSQNLKK